MRKLATFADPNVALALSEVLAADDIATEVRPAGDGAEALWILVEDQVDRAREILGEYEKDPGHPQYAAARQRAESKREQAQAVPQPADQAVPRAVAPVRAVRARGTAPVSLMLFLASALVAFLTRFGERTDLLRMLSIAGFAHEPYRLITPIFIHFGYLHLVFNVFWLLDLGVALERHMGQRPYALFIVVCAVTSNLAQFYLGGGANFGGLSGIIYALVGYLWMRGRTGPNSDIKAPPRLVTFFVLWMALGFSSALDDLFGPMANFCHLGGFVSGALLGFIAGRRAALHGLRR